MAATRACGVIFSNTSGDTVSGPLKIQSIKCIGGSTNGTVSLGVGGTTIYTQSVTANTTPQTDPNHIQVGGGQTLTITLTGTATSVYIYCL